MDYKQQLLKKKLVEDSESEKEESSDGSEWDLSGEDEIESGTGTNPWIQNIPTLEHKSRY